MVDLLTKPIPLPVDRPTGGINHRIALEGSEKLTGELFDVWSYPTTGESVNPSSGLLIEFKRHIANFGENVMGMWNQLNTGYLPDFVPNVSSGGWGLASFIVVCLLTIYVVCKK